MFKRHQRDRQRERVRGGAKEGRCAGGSGYHRKEASDLLMYIHLDFLFSIIWFSELGFTTKLSTSCVCPVLGEVH